MWNPLPNRRRGVPLVAALCAALGLITAPAAIAAPAVPALDWQPCNNGFFCATATVPLDYAHPTAATIHLAVIKHPATDPDHRIGSVLFNPGGPGGSGVAALPQVYGLFPPDLRARFDLVSFDPRGIGQSTDLQCFDTIDQEQQLLSRVSGGYPTSAAQAQVWENTWATFDNACAAHAGPLLAHDTTADVARDMDLLRQAVGDPSLNYFGGSYGTYLGATYANLFPSKVRAITLDANVDPVAWATGTDGSAHRLGTFLRMGSDEGSEAALTAFLDLCGRAATGSCAFSAGSPAATHAKYDTLLDRLANHPVTVSGRTVTRSLAVSLTVNGLYNALPIPNLTAGWPQLATLLQTLWALTDGSSAPAGNALPVQDFTFPNLGVVPNAVTPYAGREAQFGVLCSDSPHPRDPGQYAAQAAFATARSGVVGPVWAWVDEPCAQWPVLSADRYTGPWNRPTAAPILVIGNTVDPATPYKDSVAMAHDLANARLLTVHGYGHSALINHSSCVDRIEDAYFVTGALPAPGTVCQQDQAPFAG
ncbi:alpha/beta hydrolase [Actinocrispum wychmicini]|uniref:Alpha/beta hydrolase family protein n=1 Tax=Actinocrispum wychmicini TaxID=1213861 RepID=A0A4R2JQG2_9PSEU|nr:alpha/beta hydrolase [Actinocrispum wychmicini]TCO59418.1 alpha/beta hydrolase family protein [Actinocrispum wychmicini]